MKSLAKLIASKLDVKYQQELKRLHFARLIKKGRFDTDEQEFKLLDNWVADGDWVLDIGANVGVYSKKLSELVGINGRVIAIEPVLETFELLTANATRFGVKNVTLLNAAASDQVGVVGISMPKFDTGLDNYYMAQLTKDGADFSVMSLPVDCLNIPECVKLIKIDVEGHEFSVLKGMENLLRRDFPRLIVEGDSDQVNNFLHEIGYTHEHLENSPNLVFTRAV